MFLGKKRSENIHPIYKRTSILKSDFNKVAMQSSFIEITLQDGCSLRIFIINWLRIFRTLFSKNNYGGLFLKLCCYAFRQ